MTDYTLEDTIHVMFSTRAFATGIPTVLSGVPVISAYENESVTQITAGVTLGVDHDGVVGMNLITITGTATDGFESGKDYNLAITTGTVGGVSVVGEVVGNFTIGRSAAAVDLANGTDGLGAIKAETAAILADTDDIGVAGAGLTAITGAALSATGADLILKGSTFALAMADAIWDELLTGSTHNIATSAGKRLRQLDAAFEVHSGTAQAGGAATITLDTGASATDNIYAGDRIIITEGTGAQEHGLCVSYDGGTFVATMAENWVIQPDATSLFVVVPASVEVETVGHTVQTAGDLAALIVTVDTVVDAIKLVTDNFAFTVANQVDANTLQIEGADATDTLLAACNAALDTAIAELSQGVPTATPTTRTALMLMYMALRNKLDVATSGTDTLEVHSDDGTRISQKLLTDDGSDYSEAKMTSGA